MREGDSDWSHSGNVFPKVQRFCLTEDGKGGRDPEGADLGHWPDHPGLCCYQRNRTVPLSFLPGCAEHLLKACWVIKA